MLTVTTTDMPTNEWFHPALALGQHEFAAKVLPQYFRSKNFSSFVRQVRLEAC